MLKRTFPKKKFQDTKTSAYSALPVNILSTIYSFFSLIKKKHYIEILYKEIYIKKII